MVVRWQKIRYKMIILGYIWLEEKGESSFDKGLSVQVWQWQQTETDLTAGKLLGKTLLELA